MPVAPVRSRAVRLLVLAAMAVGLVSCRASDVALEGPTTSTTVASTTSESPTTTEAPTGVAGAPGVDDPYFPELGNGGYDVATYDIDLEWLPDTGTIDAVTTIELTPTEALDTFNLDLVGLDVTSVTVAGEPAPTSRAGRELTIDPEAGAAPQADRWRSS